MKKNLFILLILTLLIISCAKQEIVEKEKTTSDELVKIESAEQAQKAVSEVNKDLKDLTDSLTDLEASLE